ncbi:NYN domain-containing protein [archaeon]|jgi:uncharacterized LabA/DUF88 family protein|nr:NYN domain-containing protein [archaeon]
MEKCIVMIDAGFLSKVSRELGDGHYFKYDLLKFSKNLCGNLEFVFKHLFFYNAPPYQSTNPNEGQKKRKEEYDSFVSKLVIDDFVTIKEGRCQRLRVGGRYIYKQKGVDTLLTMGLMDIPIKYPKIKQVILIASDSDFVPVIERLKDLGIKVILFTYFNRVRNSNFSRSNDLIKSVSRYVKLKKEDFEGCKFFENHSSIFK